MSIKNEIKTSFKEGSSVTKLIYVNLGVFIIVRLLEVILMLFKAKGINFMYYLEMPALPSVFLTRPWTIFTYMFLHHDLFHILFNVLFLYWFGRFFLSYYNGKQLVGLYLIGGIVGAVFYMISFNVFPFFEDMKYNSWLLGASASILAITVGIAATVPNLEINLMFIGKIKLKYLALVIVGVDLLSVTSFNNGGHIAHLGGAFTGYLFAVLIKKGKDMTDIINKPIDLFVSMFKRKPKMKVTRHYAKNMDQEYNRSKKRESEEIDAILDKIKKSGYDNLSAEEKKKLFDQSQR